MDDPTQLVCGSIRCPGDTPVGALVYGSHRAAYIVTVRDGIRGLFAFGWNTDADRKPLPGERERVLHREMQLRTP